MCKIKYATLILLTLMTCCFATQKYANPICAKIKSITITVHELNCLSLVPLIEIHLVNSHFDYLCLAKRHLKETMCQWSVPIDLNKKDLHCVSAFTYKEIKNFNKIWNDICSAT